jgi:hypothetical protein
MTAPKDDLEAVRAVADALDGFDANAQERIIRWAREKIGLSVAPSLPPPFSLPPSPNVSDAVLAASSGKDLKSFVAEKNPKSDIQFAATIAYFHRFEAPLTERKDEIDSKDLQDACRLAGRKRLKLPGQTLRNAVNLGLLDKSGRGTFILNSVGENLVAMTLPQGTVTSERPSRRAKKRAVNKRNSVKTKK